MKKELRMARHKMTIIHITVILALIAWFSRVVYINKLYRVDTVYLNIGTQIDFGDFIITPIEANLLSVNEFENIFSIERGDDFELGIFEYDKMICLKVHIKNVTDHKLEWRDVLFVCGEGFETSTWASACDPVLRKMINPIDDDVLNPDCEIDYWLATCVARIAFKDSTWDTLSIEDFVFTLSLYPDSVKIKLQ